MVNRHHAEFVTIPLISMCLIPMGRCKLRRCTIALYKSKLLRYRPWSLKIGLPKFLHVAIRLWGWF